MLTFKLHSINKKKVNRNQIYKLIKNQPVNKILIIKNNKMNIILKKYKA